MNPISPINHLARETSPYLLQHAHNPVDWYPWGPEAFEKARSEDKPIFLSVGYSTCHWCHVMAHESFENEELARILNEHFISIKVDREERPDVDRIYMTFIQAAGGSGGWPMSVFLTPDLEPFGGGTYFPPEDRQGLPGFGSLLTRIANAWNTNRDGIIARGNQVIAALKEYAEGPPPADALPCEDLISNAHAKLGSDFDREHGGFGGAPKFPRPVTLNFLLRAGTGKSESPATATTPAREMVLFTLQKMTAGGIHDHLGGGFHRYSVDRYWHIPHFEKMLYDQAQLAVSYLEAFQITHDPFYAGIARDILDYVRRDMTSKDGGFFSAEDADSPKVTTAPDDNAKTGEGEFYLWTCEEILHLLGDQQAEVFNCYYGVEPDGNAPPESDPHGEFRGRNSLIQRHGIEETARLCERSVDEVRSTLDACRHKLFEVRSGRPRPHLDNKIITAWNGLMISAFARASQVLDDPDYLETATAAASFLRTHCVLPADSASHVSSGEADPRCPIALARSFPIGSDGVPGFADDYAFLIQGLLDLYEASSDIQWLKWADALQLRQNALFADEIHGGFFSTSTTDPSILIRLKETHDGAEPSANSISALNLLRLSQMTGCILFKQIAEQTIASFAIQLKELPNAMPQMLVALDFLLHQPKQIVIAGTPPETCALVREVHKNFIPNKILMFADGAAGQEWLGQRLDFIKPLTSVNGKPTAYVCENFICQLPTTDPAELKKQLTKP